MRLLRQAFAILVVLGVWATSAWGDYLPYKLPGVKETIYLPGKYLDSTANTIRFKHPYGILTFRRSEVDEILKSPDARDSLRSRILRAYNAKNYNEAFTVAIEILKHGFVGDFLATVKKIIDAQPDHPRANAIIELKKKMDARIEETKAEEDWIRALVDRPQMRIARSKHFVLLHDTDESARPGEASFLERRLDLLEQVYAMYLYFFAARGIPVDVPAERMRQVLFNDEKDYVAHKKNLGPHMINAVGYYSLDTNVAFFFRYGSNAEIKELKVLTSKLEDLRKDLKRSKSAVAGGKVAEVAHLTRTLEIITKLIEESLDLSVYSHETVHQLSANSGLMPNTGKTPRWAMEGFASYMEFPITASWAGMGAVSEDRLEGYRAIKDDPKNTDIRAIVSGAYFQGGPLAFKNEGFAYGQAWALTHFLMERHFEKLMRYYRLCADYRRDHVMTYEEISALFDRAFGPARKGLQAEWNEYMRTLKTDLERAVEESKAAEEE